MFNKNLILFIAFLCSGLIAVAQDLSSGIDVKHYTFNIQLNDQNNSISGQAEVVVSVLKNAEELQLNLVRKMASGKGMTVLSVKKDNKTLSFRQDSTLIHIKDLLKANTTPVYTINYEGIPADGLIIATNKYGNRTFFGDNWPDRAQNWLPCNDHPSDKASVDFLVTAPDHYQVVANGLKVEERVLADQRKLTHWHESSDLPTKVIVIGVANFAIDHSGTIDGVPVYSYVYPENKAQGFKDYALANKVIPFYNEKIGKYPYQKLANIQSKTIFGGMENASAIFYFENSVGDRDIESLIAHEIAHQWFGDAITETGWQHVWLSEGFATYMTDCYLEHSYGKDTLDQRMQQQRKKIFAFEKKRFSPVIDSAVNSNYMQILNANSYEKGAWVLHMLRNQIGEKAFWLGIRNYYKKYNGHNAGTDSLRLIMEKVSRKNLSKYFDQWLRVAGHPKLGIKTDYDEVKQVLVITVNQEQAYLYDFPLEYKIDGKLHSMAIKEKVTHIQLPMALKPAKIDFDPNIRLLADLDIRP